jgi:anti-anti-sigma factor
MDDKENFSLVFREEPFSSGFVFFLRGRLEGKSIVSVKNRINELAKSEKNNIIFDLAEVDVIDSCGLGFLVSSLSKINEKGGSMTLVRANPYLARILKLIAMPMESDYLTAVNKIEEGVKK